jgi:hypothetical protein
MEMQDVVFPIRCIDDSMKGTAVERWAKALAASTHNLGKDFERTPLYRKCFIECGFVNVQEKRLAWPIGSWARNQKMKLLGTWCKQNMLEGIQGLSMAVFTRGLGMPAAEVELLLMDVRNDISSGQLHIYLPVSVPAFYLGF